ncbi:MAG TPA: mannitol dehydrogenase family protein [Streptosporangiaceae bacterium]
MTTPDDLPRLSRAALARLDPVAQPTAWPGRTGIVHLGVGAFHRAHQAVYTEDAMAASGDDRWGICGAAPRGRSAVATLRPQDGLYTVLTRDAAGTSARVLAPLREVLHAGQDAAALTARLAAPDTRVVSLTVTEKAYPRTPEGALRTDDPAIAADLASPGADGPGSVIGILVRGLLARARADAGPVTVVSCDNIPGNGAVTARLVAEFAAHLPRPDAALLAAWLPANVRFPSTMVDRIVPAPAEADRAEAAHLLGVADAAAVATEPFRQWVIEDSFAADRPPWERAGALLVPDVVPYERMKLRLLNGAHSALAYLGGLAGHETVAEAIADPALAELVRRLMTEDAAPTLTGLAGFDLPAYEASLLARFANPALRHRTAQIAADGSQKIAPRLLAPARDRLATGAEPRWLALAIAAWIRYATHRRTDTGKPLTVDDPLAPTIAEAVTDPGDAARAVRGMTHFGILDPLLADLVTEWLSRLITDGTAATIRTALR